MMNFAQEAHFQSRLRGMIVDIQPPQSPQSSRRSPDDVQYQPSASRTGYVTVSVSSTMLCSLT